MDIRRRRALNTLVVTASATLVPVVSAHARTPATSEGPFYPTDPMRFADRDNDLVKVEGRVRQAGGEVMHLTGTVSDRNDQLRPGLRVEIWQCDANGRYLHTGDRSSIARDPDFQGFGFDICNADGRYRFRTIKPVSYPGRPPHIHVKVLDGERELLTTQFYLADHPENGRDGLFRRMSREQAQAVSMQLQTVGDHLETEVNITL
ncbi:MAG: protocatechuate 3,4-dioxygenase [Pseudomonadota bacterium]